MRLAGHFGFSRLVFVDTPTGNQCGPPSTSVRGGSPLRGAAALGSLRSPSLRRPPKGVGQNKAKQFTETLLHRLQIDREPREPRENKSWNASFLAPENLTFRVKQWFPATPCAFACFVYFAVSTA